MPPTRFDRVLASLLAAAASSACASHPTDLREPGPDDRLSEAANGQGCSGTALQGIDVYDGQGTVDWGQVAGSGRVFAYAKATQGNYYQDGEFANNWSGMKAAGMYRGAYHFLDGTLDGTTQADYFLDFIGGGTTNPFDADDLPPMLDWECNASSCGNSGATSTSNYITVAQDFINEVQTRTGKTTLVYTYQSFWDGLGNPSQFGAEPLDFAWPNSGCPPVPSPWTAWTVWQWGTVGAGGVPGVAGDCDVDVFNGDSTALASFAGGNVCTYPLGHPIGSGSTLSGGPCSGSTPATTAPTTCGAVPAGDGLASGQSVLSCDGRFTFVMQGDGNLVIYADGEALWNAGTAGNPGAVLEMQSDGNLVVYSSTGCALWSSNTGGHTGASLAVQSDGNLVIYDGSTALWSSGSGPIASPPASGCGTIPSGDGMGPGDSIKACGGCFNLVMQTDGNLVLYDSTGTALWDTQTNGKGGITAVMQTNGNFAVYSGGGCTLWQSNTGTASGAYLAVQDDGNLVVYGAGGAVEWDSGTVSCAGGCTCTPPTTASTAAATTAAATTAAATTAAATTAVAAASSTGGTGSTSAATAGMTSSSGSGSTHAEPSSATTLGATGTTSTGTTEGASHGSTTAGSSGVTGVSSHSSSSGTGAPTIGTSGHGLSGSTTSSSSTGTSAKDVGTKAGGCSSASGWGPGLWLMVPAAWRSRRRRSI